MDTIMERASIEVAQPVIGEKFPEWLAARKRAAWQRYLGTPKPTRLDETWRFSNLRELDFSAYLEETGQAATEDLVAASRGVANPAAKIVFVNGKLVHTESNLPAGVICLPLVEAARLHSELVEQHFMVHESGLGSAKWAALHEARVDHGLFLYVPEGVEVRGAVEVFHWLAGENSSAFPHTLVVTAARAKVDVIDYFQSAREDEGGLCIAYNDLYTGPEAALGYLAIQAFNRQTKMIQLNETDVDRAGRATGFVLNVGGSWTRNEAVSRLLAEEAHSDMLSVNVPTGTQEYDQRTYQHHMAPATYSDLLYKNSLYDKSRTVFSGMIVVEDDAHLVDAYQKCRNLFLSDEAEANSLPGLRIKANNVKCSHGATNAPISDDEVFYLSTRGIDPARARDLIARGFSVEVVERLGHPEAEEVVLRFLDAKLAGVSCGKPD